MPDLTGEELLLQTVSLEREVDSLKSLLNDTAEQRNGFRAHADELSVEVVKLQDEVSRQAKGAAELHEANKRLVEEKAASVREQEAQRERWSAQLEQAERDFNEMRAQLIPPNELEVMRQQLFEEGQAPWRSRVAALEQDVESARSAATAQRREAERLRAALDAQAHEHRATERETEARAYMIEAELRAKLELAQAGAAPPGLTTPAVALTPPAAPQRHLEDVARAAVNR